MNTNALNNYYNFKAEDLNTKFEGSYELLKYIISKYEIYGSQITRFSTENNYSISSCKTWSKNNKVPIRVWNIIHKDLVMLRLLGKIKEDQVMTLEALENEFQSLPEEACLES